MDNSISEAFRPTYWGGSGEADAPAVNTNYFNLNFGLRYLLLLECSSPILAQMCMFKSHISIPVGSACSSVIIERASL